MIKTVVPQVAVGVGCAFGSLLIADHFFDGSDVAFLSFFTLFEFITQLAFLKYNKMSRSRLTAYIIAVLCVGISGCLLVYKAMEIRHADVIRSYMSQSVDESHNTVAVATDDAESIAAISNGLLRKVGYKREELIGRNIHFLIPNDFNKIKEEMLVLNDTQPSGWCIKKNCSLTFRTKDGKSIQFNMSVILCKLIRDKFVKQESILLMLSEDSI